MIRLNFVRGNISLTPRSIGAIPTAMHRIHLRHLQIQFVLPPDDRTARSPAFCLDRIQSLSFELRRDASNIEARINLINCPLNNTLVPEK
jgi:hypothetical protein